MAKSVPSGIKIEYDNAGGTLVDITQYVQSINGFQMESVVEEVHTFGDSWEEYLPVGIGKLAPIEIEGLWDDTADGLVDLMGGRVPETPTTNTRTLKITWAGTKTSSVETILQTFETNPERNSLTRCRVVLQPYGTITET